MASAPGPMADCDRPDEVVFFDVADDGVGDRLIPLAAAASGWGEDMVRGPAITVALARSLEQVAASRPELLAVRATYDLHSPVPMRPLDCRTRVLRDGHRLMLIESELVVDGSVYARGRALFLSAGDEVPQDSNLEKTAVQPPTPPSAAAVASKEEMLYWSEGSRWTPTRGQHQNNRPKAVWFAASTLVSGEPLSAFGLASAVADMTNLVTNWNAEGMRHINADVSLSVARPPSGSELGAMTMTRFGAGDLAVGSALLFDRAGPLGTSFISAIPTPGDPLSFAGELE